MTYGDQEWAIRVRKKSEIRMTANKDVPLNLYYEFGSYQSKRSVGVMSWV